MTIWQGLFVAVMAVGTFLGAIGWACLDVSAMADRRAENIRAQAQRHIDEEQEQWRAGNVEALRRRSA